MASPDPGNPEQVCQEGNGYHQTGSFQPPVEPTEACFPAVLLEPHPAGGVRVSKGRSEAQGLAPKSPWEAHLLTRRPSLQQSLGL